MRKARCDCDARTFEQRTNVHESSSTFNDSRITEMINWPTWTRSHESYRGARRVERDTRCGKNLRPFSRCSKSPSDALFSLVDPDAYIDEQYKASKPASRPDDFIYVDHRLRVDTEMRTVLLHVDPPPSCWQVYRPPVRETTTDVAGDDESGTSGNGAHFCLWYSSKNAW